MGKILTLALLVSCFFVYGEDTQAGKNKEAAKTASEASEITMITTRLAVYLPKGCGKTPEQTAHKLVKAQLPDFIPFVKESTSNNPNYEITWLEDVTKDFAPPSAQYLEYFGHGLDEQQRQQLIDSKQALIAVFSYPMKGFTKSVKQTSNYMAALASQCEGFVWDSQTRQAFSVAAFKSARIASWHNNIPNIVEHTAIHGYRDGENFRMITLGMQAFGLPDIVVNQFLWSDSERINNLVNAIIQSLVEGNLPNDNSELVINFDKIQHPAIKASLQKAKHENAKATTAIKLSLTENQEGDPYNVLFEVDFSNWPGKERTEKQNTLLSHVIGYAGQVDYIQTTKRIEAASAVARKKLIRKKPAFNKGLPSGEYIIVKAPFTTNDNGVEWMWVEIVKWSGTQIIGILQNQPRNVTGLNMGAEVTVNQDEIFDYVHYFADGSTEGNETGKLLSQ